MLMGRRSINKSALVREHLLKNGNITSWEAIQQYGETRLASVIFNLRKAGYNIRTDDVAFTDRYGNTGTYALYTLEQ